MNTKDELLARLSLISETQYILRPRLRHALESMVINDEVKIHVGNYRNFLERWESGYGDRYFDMATMIRLCSVNEENLKTYFMKRKGLSTIRELKHHACYKQNIFQRVQPKTKNGVLRLYIEELGYDLNENSSLPIIQEAFLNRNLYAHNSGVIDDKYVADLKALTGIDLENALAQTHDYPNVDVVWFKPLLELGRFIEGSKKFFSDFPN